jgi:hypothetical protein
MIADAPNASRLESFDSSVRRRASSSECLNMAICSSVSVRFTPSS